MKVMRKVLLFVFVVWGFSVQATEAVAEMSVIDVDGKVSVVSNRGRTASRCSFGQRLKAGDWLSTGPNSTVRIAFDSEMKNIVLMQPNSLAICADKPNGRVELMHGSAVVFLKGRNDTPFIVRSPAGLCGSGGTGWYITTDGNITDVSVFEHKVFIRSLALNPDGLGENVWIGEGRARTIRAYQEPGPERDVSEKVLDMCRRLEAENNVAVRAMTVEKTRSGITERDGVGVNRE